MSSRPVTIVGAGIAGLTAALCLARRGFPVEIYERAPRLEEAGAGLQLSPNALRVLFGLGLRSALEEAGVAAEEVSLKSGRSGRILAKVPVTSEDGTPYISILRTDLQATLLGAVRGEPSIGITLDADLTGISPAKTGAGLDLDVTSASGVSTVLSNRPIVLAADGARSAAARCLGFESARPSGLVAWRATIEADGPGPAGIEAWLGRDHHAVAYPVSRGRRINLVAIGRVEPRNAADPPDLLRMFRGWDAALLRLITAAGPVGTWPLIEADRMSAKLPAGLVLIGDAAHAMLPFAAQGAAMAIEDAAVVADALSRTASPGEAAEVYLAARRERIERVRRRVAFHRRVYHMPWPFSLGRDLALAARPRASLRRDLAWLYDWMPPDAGSGKTQG